jgi:uncharacterized protein (UPF0332 family)
MIPPQPAWLEKSRRFLRSGNALLELGDPDSAVGRAHYAMFHAAEALLLSKGLEYSTHRALQSAYGREFAKSGLLPEKLHRALLDACESRLSADYESGPGIDSETARNHLADAKEFVDAAAKYLGKA